MTSKVYTRQELITRLNEIRDMGFVPDARPGNHGGVGNTLEDLLGIEENNLKTADAGTYEVKSQRKKKGPLVTLFHSEPHERAHRFVPRILLPKYGWPHKSRPGENSFRQTIHARLRSDRGFTVVVDRPRERIAVSFEASLVGARHADWLKGVQTQAGLAELNPQPHWPFDEIRQAAVKMTNVVFVRAATRKVNGLTEFKYETIMVLDAFNWDSFLSGLEDGTVLIDFDARTTHNHGTKFRIHNRNLPKIWNAHEIIALR